MNAACIGRDPELWFPKERDRESLRTAVRICWGCPLRVECVTAAKERGERNGVWGGELLGADSFIPRSHCKYGHEFTEQNTKERVRRDGSTARECRACIYRRIAERDDQRRANRQAVAC